MSGQCLYNGRAGPLLHDGGGRLLLVSDVPGWEGVLGPTRLLHPLACPFRYTDWALVPISRLVTSRADTCGRVRIWRFPRNLDDFIIHVGESNSRIDIKELDNLIFVFIGPYLIESSSRMRFKSVADIEQLNLFGLGGGEQIIYFIYLLSYSWKCTF